MAERVEKSWGYEEIIYNGEYCCKKLVYTKQIASSLHYHDKKHETFVVADGLFEIQIKEEVLWLGPGNYVVLPPGTSHRVRCCLPGTILESSTHDDPADCVRLIPSET